MEAGVEKGKIMRNYGIRGVTTCTLLNGIQVEEVSKLKYLDSTLIEDDISTIEVNERLIQICASLRNLKSSGRTNQSPSH